MLGSVDCMHWKWDKCPVGWRGAYEGKEDGPTMILEAVASQDLWIWHAFFGLPGSLNDINVLRRSPLFQSLTSGTAPQVDTWSMETSTQWGTILLMGYTQPGQRLSKLFNIHRATRRSTSQWHKKQRGKMWKERLGCSKLALQLCGVLQECGIRKIYGT